MSGTMDNTNGQEQQSTETASPDALTAEESAYMDAYRSGADPTPTASETKPAATPAPAKTEPASEQTSGDGEIDNELVVDESGNIRDKKTGRWVPQQALHAERTKRRSIESELAEKTTALARLDERVSILSKALGGGEQAEKAEAPPPNPETDILGYLKFLGEKVGSIEKRSTQEIEQTKARIDETETASAYRNDAIAFARERPDFGDAYSHLVKQIDAELAFRGVADPKERMATIARMERAEVAEARKMGKRPAEWMYHLAQSRGWSPPSKGAQTAAKASPEKTDATADAASKLETVQRGQSANLSLSTAGGGAAAPLTAETLANMSETDFEALLAKTGGRQNAALRKLLGG